MKKFFLIAGLMVAAVIAIAFSACVKQPPTNEAAETVTTVITPTPTPTFTPTPTTTPAPTPTTTAVKVKNRVYTNEKFGYKITLPVGHTASVNARAGAPYDQDTVTIRDTDDQEFAVIYTPMLETGAELWTTAEESDRKVPGSQISLHTWKGKPTPEAGTDNWIIWTTWRSGDDFQKSGMITFTYLPSQTSRLKTFETMMESFRFL